MGVDVNTSGSSWVICCSSWWGKGEEGYSASDLSMHGAGVRVVIGGMVVGVVVDDACVGVTTGISEVLRVVSRPGDGCGVNAGLEGMVVQIWDSSPPKPPH